MKCFHCVSKSVNTNDITCASVFQSFCCSVLQRYLPQVFALLVEPHAIIQVSILLQPHRTMVANFVPDNFGVAEPLAATRGTMRFRGSPVEKYCPTPMKCAGQVI